MQPPSERRDSPIAVILAYLIVVFLAGSLIAPRLYATAQFLEREVNWRFHWIASKPFASYVSRCILLVALIGLPILLKRLGIRSLAPLGLRSGLRHVGEGLQGVIWGFVSLLLLSAILLSVKARVLDLDHDWAAWITYLKRAGAAAIFVAFIEELLFRGALFTAFRREHSFWPAAVLSGAVYAILHFLQKPETPPRIEWNSGLIVLGQMLHGFTEWEMLLPAVLNLTLLGVLLALAFERTGALHFSIGLHAGLIFCFKSFGFLTNAAKEKHSAFWGSDKLLDGWTCGIVLLLLLLLVERTLPPRTEGTA